MKIDSIIIDKVLNNKASKEEAKLVSDWFATEVGQDYLSQRLTHESILLTPKQAEEWLNHPVATLKMRERFLRSISKTKISIRWRWVAIIIPFLLLGGSFFFVIERAGILNPMEYAEIVVPCGEQMQVVLQDGTIVHLNSDTRLCYPKAFSLFKREVKLDGEGFFEVAKDKSRPFKIDLNGVIVRVTGTKFNVKAYSLDQLIQVSLNEGSVILEDNKQKKYSLIPNEIAEYDRKTSRCLISKLNDLTPITAWRTSSLSFYRTPLRNILRTLKRQYNVNFNIVNKELLMIEFTLSTSKVKIMDILEDMETVSNVRFKQKETGFFEVYSE